MPPPATRRQAINATPSVPAAQDDADDARPADPERPRRPSPLSWAALLRRVFAVDVLVCPRCAGPCRIVGAVTVTEPHAVRRLLAALRLAAEPPPAGVAAPVTVP